MVPQVGQGAVEPSGDVLERLGTQQHDEHAGHDHPPLDDAQRAPLAAVFSAYLELQRGRRADAIQMLGDGSRNFRTRKLREHSINLLQQAFEIDPWRYAVTCSPASSGTRMSSASESARTRCHWRQGGEP